MQKELASIGKVKDSSFVNFLLSSVPSILLAEAASEEGAHARALQYYERHLVEAYGVTWSSPYPIYFKPSNLNENDIRAIIKITSVCIE